MRLVTILIFVLFLGIAIWYSLSPKKGTPPEVSPTTSAQTKNVQFYFIALEDNGAKGEKIGCNDSVVGVTREIPVGDVMKSIKLALQELLEVKQQNIADVGLYNALYQSNLLVEGIEIEENFATIHLAGALVLDGVCDSPRVEAQLTKTVLQFAPVTQVTIFINSIPLKEALSGKGE